MEFRFFTLFADVLGYPTEGSKASVRELKSLLSEEYPEACDSLTALARLVEKTPFARLEEIYSGVFELDAALHPYVGHHLFGESYKRSFFMVGLKRHYKEVGVVNEVELPDHIATILRFLSLNKDSGLAAELVHVALIPALERMTQRKEEALPAAPRGEFQGEDEAPVEGKTVEPRSCEIYREALKGLKMVLLHHPKPESVGYPLPSAM